MERAGIIEDIGSELSKFLSTETVFGEPIVINNVTLIPVQSVSLGFGGGVGTGKASKGEGQGTGSGAGAMLRPLAIVAITQAGEIHVYNFKGFGNIVEAVVEHIPETVSKLAEMGMGKKKGKGEGKEVCKEEVCKEEVCEEVCEEEVCAEEVCKEQECKEEEPEEE